MTTFPPEIITEILSRLPVKSLIRFKIVCKFWHSLIETPDFVKLHLNQSLISNSNLHLLLYYPYLYSAELNPHHNHLSFSTLHHPLERRQVHLLGSCNGVICISDPSKTVTFLSNPLTKSQFKLPDNRIPDLSPAVILFGFGFDAKSDDYKVLRLVQGYKIGKVYYEETKVFSLKTNSWKSVGGTSFYLFDVDCHGVLVNEALHFTVILKETKSKGHLIAKFDLHNDSFSLMEYPNYGGKGKGTAVLTLTNLGGCLCAMVNHHKDFVLEFADLWVMKDYGKKESWFKLYRICQNQGFDSRMQIKPIVYSKDKRKVVVEIDNLVFGWYDLESKYLEKIAPNGLPNGNIETSSFVGSLVSVGDKLQSGGGTLPGRNNKKNDAEKFLSKGFKLRL